MPQLKAKQQLKKVILSESSTTEEEAFVMLDIDPRGGDIIDVVSKDSIQGMSEFEAGLRMLCTLIKEWNFTDENGDKLPVTFDNIRLLPAGDITTIMQELNTMEGLSTSKKKS